jgi:hypothetical protein
MQKTAKSYGFESDIVTAKVRLHFARKHLKSNKLTTVDRNRLEFAISSIDKQIKKAEKWLRWSSQ